MDSAIGLLSESGVGECTLAEVARRAGLARSSVYAYYSCTDDLLDAVMDELRPTWVDAVRSRLGPVPSDSASEMIAAYVDGTIDLAADDRGVVVALLHLHDPGGRRLTGGGEDDGEFRRVLADAVVRTGALDGEVGAALVLALAFRGALLVRSGHDRDSVLATARALLGAA